MCRLVSRGCCSEMACVRRVQVSNNSTKARKLLNEADSLEEAIENSMALNTDSAVVLMSKVRAAQGCVELDCVCSDLLCCCVQGGDLDASREDVS